MRFLSLLVLLVLFPAQGIPDESFYGLRASGPWAPVSRNFFGFNLALDQGNFSYDNPFLAEQAKGVRPAALRFPGGTVSNYYHWHLKGISSEEAQAVHSPRIRARLVHARKTLKMTGNRLDFDQFMALCQAVGARAYVVLNLYTGSPEESAAWVKYARDKGYDVAGWELGNELYMREYRDRIPDVEAYIRIAKAHAAAIHRVVPDARLGVVAAPIRLQGQPKQARAWNRRLAGEHFYDAVVTHPYIGLPATGLSAESYWDYVFARIEMLRERWLKPLTEMFAGKPLWVTEWNWMGFRYRKLNNSTLNTLFVAAMTMEFLQWPQIETAMYHQLAAPGLWPALVINGRFELERARIRHKEKVENFCPGAGPCVLRTSLYFPFLLLGESLTGADRAMAMGFSPKSRPLTAKLTYNGRSFEASYPWLRSVALADSRGKIRWVDVLNLSGEPVGVDFSALEMPDRLELKCVSDSGMRDGEGTRIPIRQKVADHIKRWMTGSRASIPARSFCIVGPHD